MKISAYARSADNDRSWPSFLAFSETMMLSTIGTDLRHLYDNVTDASQPDELIRLASLIDAKRTVSREND